MYEYLSLLYKHKTTKQHYLRLFKSNLDCVNNLQILTESNEDKKYGILELEKN